MNSKKNYFQINLTLIHNCSEKNCIHNVWTLIKKYIHWINSITNEIEECSEYKFS